MKYDTLRTDTLVHPALWSFVRASGGAPSDAPACRGGGVGIRGGFKTRSCKGRGFESLPRHKENRPDLGVRAIFSF
ncbi:MAG: hypothetical protein QG636_612 [Patescibacteria group bacterium]|nr:hypothetical protein [Patescibacteria group bacterium]